MFVDTHCHLTKRFFEDPEPVVDRALAANVQKMVCVGTSPQDCAEVVKIASRFPSVFAAIGIHPQQTDSDDHSSIDTQIEKLTKLIKDPKVVAVGECGLDYSPAPPGEKDRPKNDQMEFFKKQIVLATANNLPLIVHTRKAFEDTVAVIKEFSKARGVFHCYYAGKDGIKDVLDLDFFFGFDGNLTYDPGLQNVVKMIPLEKILLETDSPYLAPVPLRGSQNEPKNVIIVAAKLAELKGVSLEEIEKVTSANASFLFGI